MRRMTSLLSWLVLATVLLALSPGGAYTTSRLRMRDAPSLSGEVLRLIPKASRVAVGVCEAGWCEVEYRGETGYVAERFLTNRAPDVRTGRGYINSQGEWVPSPVRTLDGLAPAGASARCRDGTYSFSRSRRGTCSHHGGVAEWL
jgi:uncharacterized protein YraI